jgi:hypothetical protein
MWSESGAGIGPELSETFLNSSQWSRCDLRISCLSCSGCFVGPPWGQGVAGSNPVVPTARWAVPCTVGAAHQSIYQRKRSVTLIT